MQCSNFSLTNKEMIEVQELFHIEYPPTLIFNQQIKDESGVPFVSSKGTNNGVVGRVRRNPNTKLYPKGSITVPLKGTVLNAFVQVEDFHCAHQVAVLCSKEEFNMNEAQKLFYALCVRKNKYKYNYGRQADKTFKSLLVPRIEDAPGFIHDIDLNYFNDAATPFHPKLNLDLNSQLWKWFRLDELFNLRKGKRLTKANMTKGNVPFVGAISSNNGHREHVGQKPIHSGGTITVNYNGSVAESFYQASPFWASDDVNVLYPKFAMNQYIALFFVTVIRMEKYRFNYGRKWHKDRMSKSNIKLPIDTSGNPDWQFMEDYIKSLPYSSNL